MRFCLFPKKIKKKTQELIKKQLLEKYFENYPQNAWQIIADKNCQEINEGFVLKAFYAHGVNSMDIICNLILLDFEGQCGLFDQALLVELEESTAQEVEELVRKSSCAQTITEDN
jgi:hypothetical protein